jgi:serine/threonine protein kinase
MRALFEIPRQPAPTFKMPQLWSAEMQDFLSACLTKDPEVRPSAQQLLNHAWLREVVESLQMAVPQGTSVTLRKMVEVGTLFLCLIYRRGTFFRS